MKHKIPLHWQIFGALIAAIIFGILFPTNYIVTHKSLKEISTEINQKQTLDILTGIGGQVFKTEKAFENKLKSVLAEKEFTTDKKRIIQSAYHNPALRWVEWMGIVFLRALKMIVIPLIFLSIISGILSIGSGKNLGRLGLKTILYYISTSVLALIAGLTFTDIIQPGKGIDISGIDKMAGVSLQHKSLKNVFIEIIPDNIFKSLVNNDLLSVIFISILTGIIIYQLEDQHKNFLSKLFNSFFELSIKITMFIIKLAPLGVFGLVAKVIADQDSLSNLFTSLGSFMLCVMAALFIHALVVLPSLMYLFGKNNPWKHLNNMIPAILTAFSTASSAATLPLTMSNVKDKSGVSEKIANFTLPIGTTVNMDGTAIYIAAVVLFIAQAMGLHMGFKDQFIVLVAALLASIGTAAIPMGSLVIITIILDIFGLPYGMIALILPVDRILDMFRTSVNIWSDSCGSVIVAKSEGEQLNV